MQLVEMTSTIYSRCCRVSDCICARDAKLYLMIKSMPKMEDWWSHRDGESRWRSKRPPITASNMVMLWVDKWRSCLGVLRDQWRSWAVIWCCRKFSLQMMKMKIWCRWRRAFEMNCCTYQNGEMQVWRWWLQDEMWTEIQSLIKNLLVSEMESSNGGGDL